jgi:hypothetical protein
MDYNSASYGSVVFLYILVFLLIAAVVTIGVLYAMNKITLGATGPTGPSGGPIGPTGPTGPSAAVTTSIAGVGTNLLGSIGINTVLNSVGTIANCSPCHFYSLDGVISDYQQVKGQNVPTIIRWGLTNVQNVQYSPDGIFILPVGTYTINATVVYPILNSLNALNTGGTYRAIGIWFPVNFTNNIITDNDILGQNRINTLGNTVTSISTSVTFSILNNIRNRIAVITWSDAPMPLQISTNAVNNISSFILIKNN